jgi:hypothetical protein
MDGGAHPATRFCGLHTIAELERLLGFGAGARVIARAVEDCHRSPGRCASSYACAERLVAVGGGGQAKLATLTRAMAPERETVPAAPRRSAEILQLRTAAPAQVVTDQSGNFIERRSVTTDVVRARGDSIADLLSYWTALKGEDRIPHFADIDPVRLAQLGLLGRLHVLNADNADPLLMRFDLYGNKVPLDSGRIYTGLAIGDHPVRIQSETVAADYDTVRKTAEPHYFRVRKQLGGVGYRYARLILPFSAGESGRVDRLVVAVRPEPDDGLPLDR